MFLYIRKGKKGSCCQHGSRKPDSLLTVTGPGIEEKRMKRVKSARQQLADITDPATAIKYKRKGDTGSNTSLYGKLAVDFNAGAVYVSAIVCVLFERDR